MARREHDPRPPRPTYAMRLGDDERRVIEAAAAREGVPLSVWIRRTALSQARRALTADEAGR